MMLLKVLKKANRAATHNSGATRFTFNNDVVFTSS